MASPTHRGRGLSLLHVVDAAFGDALLVNPGLAAISTIIGEAAQAVLSQAHTRNPTQSLMIGKCVRESQ